MSLPAQRSHTARGLSPGTRLGRYVVVRRIGSGGMAELYLARLDGPNRFVKPVALKLMHTHLLDEPGFVDMFLREARIAASLDHPGIVAVLDIGHNAGEHYLALEYVHGRDLRQLLADARGDDLPLGCVLRIVLDVGAALHHAHTLHGPGGRSLGIVHRDVSPSNILVGYGGTTKLADFGVARMVEQTQATATASLKGKLGYMSPEQCVQETIDRRSDVFSLGVVLYEATTGRRAFVGEPLAVMNAVIDGRYLAPERARPGYPPALAEIVRRAMAPHASERTDSAASLCAELEAFAREHGIDIRRETLAAELTRRYGAPSLPDLSVTALEGPTEPSPDAITLPAPASARVRPNRRLPAFAAALVTVLVIGTLAGWQLARTTEPIAGPTAPPSPAATAPVAAPVIVSTPTATVPVPLVIDRPSAAAPAETARPSKPASPPPPRSKRRAPAKRSPSKHPATVDPRDAMLPRSAKP